MTPDKCTNHEFFLDVGDGHQLYVHDWGNPEAKTPIIYLHGGPGAGCNDSHKQFYDPTAQRVIFFDQRGAGRSLPTAELEHNTTAELVEDIHTIVTKLGLRRFILHGRSWGSCLALCYALKHPTGITALVTGGIFLGTKAELDFDERGDRYQTFFPEVWEQLLTSTPVSARQAPISYHMNRILGSDPSAAKQSGFIYSQLILGVLKLDDRARPLDYETFDETGLKIEAHYKLNHCFLVDDYIMKHAARLTMPIWIVQGRYDVMCVPRVAYELYQQLPNSQLSWVAAGHSGSDRAVYDLDRTLLLQLAGE